MACTDPGQLQLDWSTGGAQLSSLQRPAGRHRAAVAINSCLSVEDKPNIVEFDAADVFGGINKDMENVNNNALARVSL